MVYVIDKNFNPCLPITERDARIFLKEKRAFIYRRTPFIIQLISEYNEKNKLILYINLTLNKIEYYVISFQGDIFYLESILIETANLIEKVKGVFLFINSYLPLSGIYFTINLDALFFIDMVLKREYKFVNFNYGLDFINKNTCNKCDKTLDNKNKKIYKIIKHFNFNGNNLLLCKDCYKEYLNNYIDKYSRDINKIFDLLIEIERIIWEDLKN